MYKVALLDAEHWHVLGHLDAMKKFPQVKVVALSGDGEFTKKLSKDLGVKRYENYRELLDNEEGFGLRIHFRPVQGDPDHHRHMHFARDSVHCRQALLRGSRAVAAGA